MSDGDPEIYFMTIEVFHEQSAETIESLKKIYDINFEEVTKSYIKEIYWSITCNVVIPYEYEKYEAMYANLGDECMIFRKKNCEKSKIPEVDKLMELVLYSPVTMANIPTKPRRLKNSGSNSENAGKMKKSHVIYKFPEMTVFQQDYVITLFSAIVRRVSNDQEFGGLPVKNSMINRAVHKLTLENIDFEWYLIFEYMEKSNLKTSPFKSGSPVLSLNTDLILPEYVELDFIIPFDADDDLVDLDLESPDIGMTEDGVNGVVYEMKLVRH